MKEYKPVDSFYEDIYDFDDINGKFDGQQRLGKTFSLDEYGHIVRSTHRPKINDDRVHLPPVVVGKSRVAAPTIRSENNNGSAGLWNRDIDMIKERHTLHGYVTSKTRRANANLDNYTRNRPDAADDNAIYKSLMEGLHDVSLLERSPQVQEYERRNKIRQEANLTQMRTGHTHGLSKDPDLHGEVFTQRVKQYEESIKTESRFQHEINYPVLKSAKEFVHQPAPPTAPKPDDDKPSYNRNRKWHRVTNNQLGQDVSVHNPPAPYHRPKTPMEDVEIDYDSEVQEALRVQKELDLLHQELEKMKKAERVHGMEMLRPSTAAAANSNLQGCSSPCSIPTAAVPYKSVGPVKPWNCENAKRGLGFRSKIKREEQTSRKIDVNNIPEKIRKEMKKYFG